MNNTLFTDLVNYSDSTFSKCFDTLMQMKAGEIGDAQALITFQPDLASCMLNIMNYYHQLCSDEQKYIDEKASYQREEFSELMSGIATKRKALKKLISIGKLLGDGFAWFFYRNSTPQLRKHLEHSTNGLFPNGIGGEGEVEFIKRNQNIDGYFVVYHSITSMLRIGDFSLCSIDGTVVAIGELKSQKQNNKICISAYVSSKVVVSMNGESTKPTQNINPNPTRLNKELQCQDDLLKAKDADIHTSKESTGNNLQAIINAISNGDNVAVSPDKTLVVLSDPHEGSFEDLLINKEHKSYELPIKFSDAVQEIIIKDSPFNEIWYSKLSLEVVGFRKPVIWWEMPPNYIRDIIWGKQQIFVILNVAHFYSKLEHSGFSLSLICKENGKSQYNITKKIDNRIVTVGATEMLIDLMLHNFRKASEVVDLICSLIDETKDLHKGGNMKIELLIDQHL